MPPLAVQSHDLDAAGETWDQFLESAGREAGFLQSRLWAAINVRMGRAAAHFLSLEGEDGTVAQALVLSRVQWPPLRIGQRLLLPYLECHGGPVVREGADHARNLEEVVRFVRRLGRRSLATHIVFSPSPTSGHIGDLETAAVFRKQGFAAQPWGTLLVDLTPSEEQLLAGVKPAARKGIRKSKELGLRFTEARSLEDVMGRFYRSYAAAETHYGRPPAPFSLPQWQEDRKRAYRYYMAEDGDGEVLACLGMYAQNGLATEIMSSLSPMAFAEKIPAQDFLHWELLLEARRLGCHTFDLAGVHPAPTTPGEAGIRRFKEKWGGPTSSTRSTARIYSPVGAGSSTAGGSSGHWWPAAHTGEGAAA